MEALRRRSIRKQPELAGYPCRRWKLFGHALRIAGQQGVQKLESDVPDLFCAHRVSGVLTVSGTLGAIIKHDQNLLAIALCASSYPIALRDILTALSTRHRRLRERTVLIEGDLPKGLRDGTIRLLKVRWLREQGTTHRLRRRQDLDEQAFVEPVEAERYLGEGKVASLSHRWLTPEHPDPESFTIGKLCEHFLQQPISRHFEAIFIDFCSLPQKSPGGVDRTQEEQVTFKAGLELMSPMYASPYTLVVQQKQLPEALVDAG
eukprot:3439278-Prymnesium_polylepis.1